MTRCIALTVIALLNAATCSIAQTNEGGLSHLDAHRMAAPPSKLLKPLGDETLAAIIKGHEPAREQALATALLGAALHCPVLKVGVASNGFLTAGIVKLQAGDKQSRLFSVCDVRDDAVLVVRTASSVLPELDHLDLWVTVPWLRDFEPVHRPVFSLSVPRERINDCLADTGNPEEVLTRCGGVRLGPEFTAHAIDGSSGLEVQTLRCDLLIDPALDTTWREFGALARDTGELDDLQRGRPVAGVISGPRGSSRIALTIDDGPRPLITPLVLDILRRANVKATFFVVGEKVEHYPELARMIVRDGHELANHSYSHIRLNELNPRGVWSQVRGCDVAVERVTGQKMQWFRPPGGMCDDLSLQVVNALGHATVLWTSNTADWSGIGAEEIVRNGLSGLRPGGVLLMHQGSLQSVAALPGLLRGIAAMELEPGPVSDLLTGNGVGQLPPDELVRMMDKSRVY